MNAEDLTWTDRIRLLLATVTNERSPDAKHVKGYHRPVIEHLLRGELRDAERECMTALESNPEDPLLFTLYAIAIWDAGDAKEIRDALQRAHDISNGLCITWNAMGDFSGQIEDKFNAIMAYSLSIAIDEDQTLPRKLLFVYYSDAKLWDEGIRQCREIIRIEPYDSGTWGNLELCLSKLDDTARAEQVAHEMTKAYPDNYLSWWAQGTVQLHLEKWDETEYSARRAIQLNREDAECYQLLALSFLFRNLFSAAIKSFRKAVTLKPNDGGAWYNLGAALLMDGKLEEADKALERLAVLDPELDRELAEQNLKKLINGGGFQFYRRTQGSERESASV